MNRTKRGKGALEMYRICNAVVELTGFHRLNRRGSRGVFIRVGRWAPSNLKLLNESSLLVLGTYAILHYKSSIEFGS
jgi:hypothetical protein